MRGTFANVRLRNQLAPGTEGGITLHLPDGERDHHLRGGRCSTPTRVCPCGAGRQGVRLGLVRDWAAKGTALLGVRAVIAQSYERIHRSNLIGMGVLPLQYARATRPRAGTDRPRGLHHHRASRSLNDGELPKELTVVSHGGRRLGHRVRG
jgi:aconitate hydratase